MKRNSLRKRNHCIVFDAEARQSFLNSFQNKKKDKKEAAPKKKKIQQNRERRVLKKQLKKEREKSYNQTLASSNLIKSDGETSSVMTEPKQLKKKKKRFQKCVRSNFYASNGHVNITTYNLDSLLSLPM